MPQMPPPQWHGAAFVDHPWWGFLGWLLPVLLIGLLVVVAIVVVTRTSRHEHPQAEPPPNRALEQVRLRYANGEIGQEEFEKLSSDLSRSGT